MKITLDTESQSLADKFLAYTHQPPDALTGLVHDALLTGSLSRGVDSDLRREVMADVTLDGRAVELDLTVPFGADPRIVLAGSRVHDLAKTWDVAPDVVALAAVRIGMRKLCPPADILAAGGVK